MTIALDQDLVRATKRKPGKRSMSFEECVALHLFKLDGVSVTLLSKAFRVSRNTIYYRALTGEADSYPTSEQTNTAREVKELIERLGVKRAQQLYWTEELVARVHAVLKAEKAAYGRH